ncbi:hypothetical protein [Pelagibaculum spongiae]|uniref:Lipoprotein n=1 Tax=Pelagibaculum spongiae TaxID=2080658 RepID=A0A2V1GZA6_9GAMM|nr:hypothetical protein [Pelagibaculum spongiae]PVZ72401.1 hypothetical protein DC094_05185 [Pelagibaculum spongiae]
MSSKTRLLPRTLLSILVLSVTALLLSSCATSSSALSDQPVDQVARAHNCQVAKTNLDALLNHQIITRSDASGNEVELTASERKKAVQLNQRMKDSNCS